VAVALAQRGRKAHPSVSRSEKANELVLKDRQRLPIVAVGFAWAMQKGKVMIRSRVDEDTLAMNIKPATN